MCRNGEVVFEGSFGELAAERANELPGDEIAPMEISLFAAGTFHR